ncbi:Rft-1-domain-containing protein [Gyrodon lividus]|nr:Rft-1-domain-containing protein [Gyrodon lividus]
MSSKTRSNSKDNRLLIHSFNSARSLIGLQLASRLFTFVLNQGLVRLASPQAYGTVAVQFELLTSTILFLSREGIRNSLLRVWPQEGIAVQGSNPLRVAQCANLATLPALLSLPTMLVTVALYTYSASEATRTQPYFYLALFTYVTAAFGELLSEPMHNRAMGEVRTGIRVSAEGLGISIKTIITYLVLLYDSSLSRRSGELALMAFALGQFAYSVVVFAVYTLQMPESSLLPSRLSERHQAASKWSWWHQLVAEFFDPGVLYLSMTMASQSVVKHFLTEGDKFLVSYWSPLQDQGGYAIAANYGSLIARIVLQPIEEMCRVYFSKLLSDPTPEERSAKGKRSSDSATLKQASDTVAALLSIQIAFSLLVVTFGSLYLPIVLQLLLPVQYISTSASKVLSAWIWYIPVLAINGGLEAFYSSVAIPDDLHRQSRWMLGFSAIYILSATALYNLGFGDTSLVYANIVNLTARIWYTAFFVLAYFEKRAKFPPFRPTNLSPNWKFLVIVGLSYGVILYNEARQHLLEHVQLLGRRALLSILVVFHVALGGGMGLVCVGIWWMTEGKQLVARERIKVA